MYIKSMLFSDLEAMGIKSTDTLLVHSSMKSIGPVIGGADTVLDAFSEYLSEGLLIFPTHTWNSINAETHNTYDYKTEPSCVGALTNIFMKRPGVIRSLHPTHSVAALGKDAADYVAGEEYIETPCNRNGCWGKLYDRKAKILFLGCPLKRNTFIHGVEEWMQIADRLSDEHKLFNIVLPDGSLFERPMICHHSSVGDVSLNYDKLELALLAKGIGKEGSFGDARCVICDVVSMADLICEYLKKQPLLFSDNTPIPSDWYLN